MKVTTKMSKTMFKGHIAESNCDVDDNVNNVDLNYYDGDCDDNDVEEIHANTK